MTEHYIHTVPCCLMQWRPVRHWSQSTAHCVHAVHWTVGISAFCKCVISLCMISSVIFYATMSGNALTEAIFSSCAKTCVCVGASRVYCIVSIGRNLIRPKIAPLRHLSLVHYCVSPCSCLSSQGHLAGANWVLAASLYWGFALQSLLFQWATPTSDEYSTVAFYWLIRQNCTLCIQNLWNTKSTQIGCFLKHT